MTTAKLIVRLQEATGPDRELFEAAYVAVFGKASKNDSDAMARWLWFLDVGAWTDAAMMLLPVDKEFKTACWAIDASVFPAKASVWDDNGKHEGKHPEPAIALLIAILKARP